MHVVQPRTYQIGSELIKEEITLVVQPSAISVETNTYLESGNVVLCSSYV